MSLVSRDDNKPLDDISNLLPKKHTPPVSPKGTNSVDHGNDAKENLKKNPAASLAMERIQKISEPYIEHSNQLTAKFLEKLAPSVEEIRKQFASTKHEIKNIQLALTKRHIDSDLMTVVDHAVKGLAKLNNLSPEVIVQIPRFDLELERIISGILLLVPDGEILKKNGDHACYNKDPSLARVYYEIGARKGNVEAAICLALLLKKGEGGPQNLKKARKYFEQGARCFDNKKLPKSEFCEIAVCELIDCYEKGLGGEPNINRAKALYQKLSEEPVTNVSTQEYILEFVIARGDPQAIQIHEEKLVNLWWEIAKSIVEKCGGRFLMVTQNVPHIQNKFIQSDNSAHENFYHQLEELEPLIIKDDPVQKCEIDERGSCVGMVVEFSVEVEKDTSLELEQRLCNAARKYKTKPGITALALHTLYTSLLIHWYKAPPTFLKRRVCVYSSESSSKVKYMDLTDTFQEINRGNNLIQSLAYHHAEARTFKAVGKKLSSLTALSNLSMTSDQEYLLKWSTECPDGEYRLGTNNHCLYLTKSHDDVFLLDPSIGLSVWPKERCANMLSEYLNLLYGSVPHYLDIRRIDTL